jgi:Sec-independent protein secretion pathway component TatC
MDARDYKERHVDRRWRMATVVVVILIFAIGPTTRHRDAIAWARRTILLWGFGLLWFFGFVRARARIR